MLLHGWRPEDMERELSKRYSCATRTIRDDIRLVYIAWGKTDDAVKEKRRTALTRRLDRIARVAEREGQLAEAIEASRLSAVLHGLAPPGSKGLGPMVEPPGWDWNAPPERKAP
jgi:hypothetical protein